VNIEDIKRYVRLACKPVATPTEFRARLLKYLKNIATREIVIKGGK